MAKQRESNLFTLSFLDVMSCGFGAVILLYVIILQYNQDFEPSEAVPSLPINDEKISSLEQKIKTLLALEKSEEERFKKTAVDNQKKITSIKLTETRVKNLIDENKEKKQKLQEIQRRVSTGASKKDFLEDQELEQVTMLRATMNQAGGFKEVLTGMRLGGSHILIFLDSSSSMLAEDLVNIIRRRNMEPQEKILSPKWQRGISFVEWIMEKIPEEAKYQVVHFNEKANYVLPNTAEIWLDGSNDQERERIQATLKKVAPSGGTSLYHAFSVITSLSPMPDNVYLVVDSLPTMNRKVPKKYTISSQDRRDYFRKSVSSLPENVPPINVILFPMEADPYAPIEYWELADKTGGSFIQPQKDWPR